MTKKVTYQPTSRIVISCHAQMPRIMIFFCSLGTTLVYSRSNPLFIMRKRASLSWERAPSVYCDATVGNPPVLHCPHSFLIFLPNLRRNSHLESPLTSVFSSTTLRNSAVTTPSPNPKVHHPAMDSLVLSLQCGKGATVFVSSRHREFVAHV